MPDNPVDAVTTFADCPDCASVVHTVHRPGGLLAVEVEHSTPCPAWPYDRREVAIVFYGQGTPSTTTEGTTS